MGEIFVLLPLDVDQLAEERLYLLLGLLAEHGLHIWLNATRSIGGIATGDHSLEKFLGLGG